MRYLSSFSVQLHKQKREQRQKQKKYRICYSDFQMKLFYKGVKRKVKKKRKKRRIQFAE